MVKENSTIRPMSPQEQKLALMLKALGNPVRFQIVQILAEKQACITGEIVEFTTLAQSTVSQHLKVLCEAGLITGDIDGPAVCYCLNEANILWMKERLAAWLPQCCVLESTPAETRPAACCD
jgi:ArsR family transcriptional regulator